MKFHAPISKLPGQTDDLRNDKFGDRAAITEGRVEHSYTLFSCTFEIDLVRTDAEAANNKEIGCRFQDTFCKLSFGADTKDMDVPSRCQ